MKSRLTKLPDLEKNNESLFKVKVDLLETVGKLSLELKEAKDGCFTVNKELASLIEKFHKAESDNEALKIENSKLSSRQAELQAENNKSAQAGQAEFNLEKENTKLRVLVAELRANQAGHVVGGAPASGKETTVLEIKVKNLEDQNTKLQTALEEWTALAKVPAQCDMDITKIGS
jgi:chromosome segregation ATPase